MNAEALLAPLAAACREAGERILAVRRRGFEVERKGDASPVTEADRAAESVLLEALARHAPGIPVIAEEEVAAGRVPAVASTFFLVDPLDGTREFVSGGDDYTVNVGLIVDGEPLLGLVLAPEQGRLWTGLVGTGAWLEEPGCERKVIQVQRRHDQLRCVVSRSHMNQSTHDYIAAAVPDAILVPMGSSLKFCLVAQGSADIYPRLSPTSEWDTAAGHAIVLAAGGQVRSPDGGRLDYGKPGFLNEGFMVTTGCEMPVLRPFMAR